MLIVSVIAYGGVDVWMMSINSILAGLIAIFWLTDTWKTKVFRFNSSFLQIPLLGLILIGIIQLIPFRSNAEINQILSIPAAGSLSLNPYLTRLFIMQLIIGFVFFAAALVISNRRRFQSIVLTILIFGSIIAFLRYFAISRECRSRVWFTTNRAIITVCVVFQQTPFRRFYGNDFGLDARTFVRRCDQTK